MDETTASAMDPTATARKSWGLQFVAGIVLGTGIFAALIFAVVGPVAQLNETGGDVNVVTEVNGPLPRVSGLYNGHPPVPSQASLARTSDVVQLQVQDLPTQLRLLAAAPAAWASLAVLAACWMLFGLLRSIGEGRPFADANVRRLHVLSGLVIVGVLGANLLEKWAATAVLTELGLDGSALTSPPVFALAPFLIALLILAVAEAFRHGRALQRDVSGLV